MNKYYIPLLPNETYHLFNRAIGNEKLFKTNENFFYFLRKFSEHTCGVCETYCYCLLPNHFHLLVRIRDTDVINEQYSFTKKSAPPVHDTLLLSDFIMERFSNWLNSYTKSFNKMFDRKGALFIDYTKRSCINKDSSFGNIIHCIHANPVHHGLCKKIGDWKYSSYNSLTSDLPTKLLRSELIEWFGSKDEFIRFHQQPVDLKFAVGFE